MKFNRNLIKGGYFQLGLIDTKLRGNFLHLRWIEEGLA